TGQHSIRMSTEDSGAAATGPAAAGATDGNDDSGWTQAKPRRQPEKPKFIVFMDKARQRRQPSHRAFLMATQPQSAVQPLFPGCASDSDSDSEPDDNEDDDASGRKFPKFVLADVQCLLSYMLLTYRCLQQPRWCKIAKPNCVPRILVIVFDSAPPSAAAQLPKFMANFYQAMRLMSPYAYSDRVGPDLFSLPLQSVALGDRQLLLNWLQKRRKKLQTGSTAAAAGEASPAARSDISIGTLVDPPEKHAAFPERDRFPRTQLLLSSVQLLHENYPMPGLRSCGGGGPQSGPDYKTSLPAYQPAGPSSPMFGLDCEMVVTEGPAGESSQQHELARATLVDESGRILLDQLVKPANPVLNYLTAKSGITREMLDKATVTLAEVQDQLAQLLPPNAILVGHSLNCDLHALRLYHPSCIDTSVVFNLSGHRRHKSSLKSLAQRFLGRDIQSDDAVGHNSAEDALAALNLVQLKLARSLEFGDAASGDWNPSAADADAAAAAAADSPPSAKRPRIAAEDATAAASPARPGHGGFHASHSAGATTASLFDWLRMHGVSFRVFDRVQSDGHSAEEYLASLPSTYLVADSASDAAAVEAARAEVKCSRLVVLRLRDRDCNGTAATDLSGLDEPLAKLMDSMPQYSMCIALFPGRRQAASGTAGETAGASVSVARCYFSMRGMVKPQSLGKTAD
ncbi:hypothetical protein BOX15_Mlig032549g3, partial [Macrostomum lignano]